MCLLQNRASLPLGVLCQPRLSQGRNVVIFIRLFFSFPQEAEIDNIHQLVVGATENIKEGNEDIREVDGLWGLLGRGSCMVLLAPCGEGLAVDCGVDFAC